MRRDEELLILFELVFRDLLKAVKKLGMENDESMRATLKEIMIHRKALNEAVAEVKEEETGDPYADFDMSGGVENYLWSNNEN